MNSIRSIWSSVFLAMPPAVRGMVLAATVGGVAGIVLLLHTMGFTGPVFYWSITIGVIVIALLGSVMAAVIRWRKKRQAKVASSIIKDSSGGAEGVSAPDEIARLDQLRKDWDAAVKKFEENNDDGLYSLPWYLLVGEPGSGKTEAIRHSGIPFPTGLNKPNQGTGGTYNMDWWFANDAVIIDTAGRLLFNETREWTELLTRLGKLRPHCPINGMLLVIPTDSLLKDSSSQIETKASRIAEQINSIKRELGIRFPVFVVITKSDYITGFREYFSHLDDPSLEHQMMGWSNPHPLDEPFNPDLVDEHLESVSERLRRRRTAMLLDPPLVDESSDRTTDQVDALYAFPEEIKRIKNRLRLYMEQIFTPGPWSKKPPFIRGIYFTSSMQEGKELDTALAELLNVEVNELPEGRVWKKDKAYFLRDLFLQKVFPEKGLVTRAVNAAQNYRRNKLIVNGIGVAVILLSLTLGVMALFSFNRTIGQAQLWWDDVASASNSQLPRLVKSADGGTIVYGGNDRVDMRSGSLRIVEMLERSAEYAERSIAPRGLLRPIEFLSRGDIDGNARRTNAEVLNHVVLTPLAEQTHRQIAQGWTPQSAEAVSQLLRMTRYAHTGVSQRGNSAEPPQIAPLVSYVLGSGDHDGDVAALQSAASVVYSPRGYTNIDARAINNASRAGIEKWRSHWTGQAAGEGGLLNQLTQLKSSLEAFNAAENSLLDIVTVGEDCPRMEHAWREQYQQLASARRNLDTAANPFIEGRSQQNIFDSVKNQLQEFKSTLQREYEMLAAELPEVGDGARGGSEALAQLRTSLDTVWEEIRSQRFGEGDALVSAIGEFEGRYLTPVDDGRPAFASRGDKYRAIHEELSRSTPQGVTMLTLDREVADIQQRIASLRRSMDVPASSRPSDADRHARVMHLLRCGCDTAERVQVHGLYEIVQLPGSSNDVAEMVRQAAGEVEMMPVIQLTVLHSGSDRRRYDAQFHPASAERIIRGWLRLAGSNNSRITGTHRSAFDDYVARYVRYWTNDVPAMGRFAQPATWADLQAGLTGLYVGEAIESLKEIGNKIIAAMAVLEGVEQPEAWPFAQRTARETSSRVRGDFDRFERLREHYGSLRMTWRLESPVLRSRILRMDAVSLIEQYFPRDYSEGEDAGVLTFWNSLALGCLQMLANDALGEIENARRLLAASYNRFPLVADGDVGLSLTVSQMRDANVQVRILERPESAIGQSPRGGRTIGAGERTMRHRLVDEQLDRLCGIDGAQRWEDDRESADRRAAVGLITAALAGDEPLRAEVIAWGDLPDRRSSAVGPYQAFELVVDGRSFDRQQTYQSVVSNDMQFEVTREQVIRLDLGELDGVLTARAPIEGPWPLLALLAKHGVSVDCAGMECSTWDVKFVVSDGNEFWVRIRFNHPLPQRRHWPTGTTWPFK